MTPFQRALPLPVAGVVLAGCGAFASMAQGPAENLSTWSLTPLPPDPALAAEAVRDGGACRMDDPSDNVVAPIPQILVQDRRTRDTAAFLVASAAHFGDCTITRSSSGGGGYGPALGAMNANLTIENVSSGTIGDDTENTLGGRIGIPAAKVVVTLTDNRVITASMANGFWLVWWPGSIGVGAINVIAFDGEGKSVATLEVPSP